MEVTAVSAVAEGASVRRPPRSLLPPAGRQAHVVPGDRCRQRVREFAGDAEATRDDVRRAVRVAVLQVGTERGQAAEALLLAAAGAAEGEVTGGDRGGAAGLAVPLQEERTRTSGTQLLLHHATPGTEKNMKVLRDNSSISPNTEMKLKTFEFWTVWSNKRSNLKT